MTSADLYAKASALESLADDVEVCVDSARTVAGSERWECENADDVRGAIDHWRSAARSAAHNLRDEASRVRGDARRAADREQDEREASKRQSVR